MKGRLAMSFQSINEDDLSLGFSKDFLFAPKISSKDEYQVQEDSSTKLISKSKGSKAKVKIDDISKQFFSIESKFDDFSSVQQADNDLTQHSIIRQYSQNPVRLYFEGSQVKEEASSEQVLKKQEESEGYKSIQEASRQKIEQEQEPSSEQKILQKMKQLKSTIRKATIQLNQCKNKLQKDSKNDETIFQTKDCPCCGKSISKLCFKCQHIKCIGENCPRKKKQKLNARMLQKMRTGKKGGKRKRRIKQQYQEVRLSRSRDKSKGNKSIKEESLQSAIESDEEDFSDFDLSDFEESSQEEILQKKQPQKKTPIKPKVWNKTMSDVSLSSKLFFDSDQQSKQ